LTAKWDSGGMTNPATEQTRRSYVTRHWRGEVSLAKSFWLDTVALSILIFFLTLLFAGYVAATFRREPGHAVLLIVVAFLIGLCSFVWSVVGLKRSARSYKGLRVWAVLAAIVTIPALGLMCLFWVSTAQTLIRTYYYCTTGEDFGELAPLLDAGAPCEVAFRKKQGLVVRRLAWSPSGRLEDPFDH
jgi:hypothetical protein